MTVPYLDHDGDAVVFHPATGILTAANLDTGVAVALTPQAAMSLADELHAWAMHELLTATTAP